MTQGLFQFFHSNLNITSICYQSLLIKTKKKWEIEKGELLSSIFKLLAALPKPAMKRHSRTSPEIQFKELNEKLRSTLPNHQINCTMPAKTQTNSSQKIEKQTIKQTKQKYNHC